MKNIRSDKKTFELAMEWLNAIDKMNGIATTLQNRGEDCTLALINQKELIHYFKDFLMSETEVEGDDKND